MSNFVTPDEGEERSQNTIQTGSDSRAIQTGSAGTGAVGGGSAAPGGGAAIQTGSDGRAIQTPTDNPAPKLPWMEWEVGERVVVRYRKPDGLYDALGHLTEVAADHVTVNTRKGLVTVPAKIMVTGKRVPESPFGA